MYVVLNYMGQLRQLAGTESERKEYSEPVSLLEVLRDAAGGHDPRFAKILFTDEGELRRSVMVLVNEATVSKDPLPSLSDGDEVTLLTPIAGG